MMATYQTNLRCAGCLQSIKPYLDSLPGLTKWHVDIDAPGKPLTVDGPVSEDDVRIAMGRAGYEITSSAVSTEEAKPSYYPLLLIIGYLVGASLVVELTATTFEPMRFMRHFMAGFFLVFSFFKLLDLPAFALAYTQYDVLARRWVGYGYIYPFLELGLGIAYLMNWQPMLMNIATLILMAIGTVGVLQTILAKRKVKCACLGAAINLPVATVTLIEDVGMGVMALAMLATR